MKTVIATLFQNGPVFVLADGTVMVPDYQATGHCWVLDWKQSSEYTTTIRPVSYDGVQQSLSVVIFKNGTQVYEFSTAV